MIEFTLYMVAQSVQFGGKRMMINKKSGKPVFFRNKRTQAYLDEITLLAKPFVPVAPMVGPLRVRYMFVMPRPQALMGKKHPDWLLPMPARPDIDAFPKGLSDVLTACGFWQDDSQIIDLQLFKRYAERTGRPRIEVMIEVCGGSEGGLL